MKGGRDLRAHPGQAMVEAVLAVLIVTSVFVCLFRASRLLTGKILLEHAALRVARARAVGLNDFMCEKTARVAVLPAAGRLLWPETGLSDAEELSRVPIYLATPDGPTARGVLEYDGWNRLNVNADDSRDVRVTMSLPVFGDEASEDSETVALEGTGGIEPGYTLYMDDQGR